VCPPPPPPRVHKPLKLLCSLLASLACLPCLLCRGWMWALKWTSSREYWRLTAPLPGSAQLPGLSATPPRAGGVAIYTHLQTQAKRWYREACVFMAQAVLMCCALKEDITGKKKTSPLPYFRPSSPPSSAFLAPLPLARLCLAPSSSSSRRPTTTWYTWSPPPATPGTLPSQRHRKHGGCHQGERGPRPSADPAVYSIVLYCTVYCTVRYWTASY